MSTVQQLAGALLMLPSAACATALDPMRDGQSVVSATIERINSDPAAWDGKWVRLEGWIDGHASVIADDSENLMLDPAKKLKRVGMQPGEPKRHAAVSGRVDLTCWRFWQDVKARLAASSKEARVFLDVWAAGSLEHCNRSTGPYLVDVLIASRPEPHK